MNNSNCDVIIDINPSNINSNVSSSTNSNSEQNIQLKDDINPNKTLLLTFVDVNNNNKIIYVKSFDFDLDLDIKLNNNRADSIDHTSINSNTLNQNNNSFGGYNNKRSKSLDSRSVNSTNNKYHHDNRNINSHRRDNRNNYKRDPNKSFDITSQNRSKFKYSQNNNKSFDITSHNMNNFKYSHKSFDIENYSRRCITTFNKNKNKKNNDSQTIELSDSSDDINNIDNNNTDTNDTNDTNENSDKIDNRTDKTNENSDNSDIIDNHHNNHKENNELSEEDEELIKYTNELFLSIIEQCRNKSKGAIYKANTYRFFNITGSLWVILVGCIMGTVLVTTDIDPYITASLSFSISIVQAIMEIFRIGQRGIYFKQMSLKVKHILRTAHENLISGSSPKEMLTFGNQLQQQLDDLELNMFKMSYGPNINNNTNQNNSVSLV